MKLLYLRFVKAAQMAWMAFNNPFLFDKANFKTMAKVLEIVLKVGAERRPMMFHVAYVYPSFQEKSDVVSIWAGAGVGANPTERIKELVAENEKLKKILAEEIKKSSNE